MWYKRNRNLKSQYFSIKFIQKIFDSCNVVHISLSISISYYQERSCCCYAFFSHMLQTHWMAMPFVKHRIQFIAINNCSLSLLYINNELSDIIQFGNFTPSTEDEEEAAQILTFLYWKKNKSPKATPLVIT